MDILERITQLSKKTGDKFVVFDKNDESAFVILPLEEYEDILDDGIDFSQLSDLETIDEENDSMVPMSSEIDDNFEDDDIENEKEVSENDKLFEQVIHKDETEDDFEDEGDEEKNKYYFEPIE